MQKHKCSNCGSKISDIYCSCCGQRGDIGRLSLGSVRDGLLSTLVGDGFSGEKGGTIRYGVLRTLWQIFRHPHTTIKEYLSGKQRKYFNPITLLMLISAVYAVIIQFLIPKVISVSVSVGDDSKVPAGVFNYISDYIYQHPATSAIAMIPFFALSFKWFFRKFSKLNYVEYLYIEIIISTIILPVSLFSKLLEHYWLWYEEYNWIGFAIWIVILYLRASIYRHVLDVNRRRIVFKYISAFVLSYTMFAIICALLLVGIIWSMGLWPELIEIMNSEPV